jgi:hypothetical protein
MVGGRALLPARIWPNLWNLAQQVLQSLGLHAFGLVVTDRSICCCFCIARVVPDILHLFQSSVKVARLNLLVLIY